MSKYREIQTEFRSLASLKAALEAVFGKGSVQVAAVATQNILDLESYWVKGMKSAVVVRKTSVQETTGHSHVSSDLGFSYDHETKTYKVQVNDMDEYAVRGTIAQVKQAYAKTEIQRQAKAKGYTIREVRLADGTIQLQLNHR
jgi:hypothetical protein